MRDPVAQTDLIEKRFWAVGGRLFGVALPRLPDWAAVGGNVRHTSGWARSAAVEDERSAWTVLLRQAGAPEFPEALLAGPVRLRIHLHLPTEKGPDFENAAVALKTLIDLLEAPRIVWRGKHGAIKGLLGWITDDRQIVWPWDMTKTHKSPRAPMTELEVQAL